MNNKKKQLISIDDIFRQSWLLFKQRYNKWLIPNLLYLALSFLIVLIILILIVIGSLVISWNIQDLYNYNFTFLISFIIFFSLITFGFLFLAGIITTIISVRILLAKDYSDPIKILYYRALRYFWLYLGLTVLLSLIISIAYLFFIIPGIILTVYLLFSFFILLDKKEIGIFGSMKKSWQLVKGHFWPVFGRLLLFTLIYLTAACIIGVFPFVSLAIYFVLMPYYFCVIIVLYQDLKRIKKII